MSRVTRINELVLHELSDVLHTRFRDRSVAITLSGVETAPDLRSARVFYSVLGDARARVDAEQLFSEIKGELRTLLGKHVILKYTPHLEFVFDESIARGSRVISVLEELAAHGEFDDPAAPPTEPPPVEIPPARRERPRR
jgi:ribosome-binding factor A